MASISVLRESVMACSLYFTILLGRHGSQRLDMMLVVCSISDGIISPG